MKNLIISLLLMLFGIMSAQAEKIVVAYLTSGSNEMPTEEYVTHINYAFGQVNATFDGITVDRPENLKKITSQKGELKVLLSIGGWTSGGFSEMAASTERRLSFAKYIDFKAIEPIIDFVNLMVYDVARPPYHHAPLYKSDMTNSVTCQESVALHMEAGLPADKIVLGMPFYGHGIGNITDFIDYKDIINLTGYTQMRDDVAKVPYLINAEGKLVCTYEDAESIAEKCRFIHDNGLKGAMYWDYCIDDAKYTLRKAVAKGILNK